MDRASRYVIAREDNVVHVDFDRDSKPKPTFPGAGALRAESSSDVHADFRSLAFAAQGATRKLAGDRIAMR